MKRREMWVALVMAVLLFGCTCAKQTKKVVAQSRTATELVKAISSDDFEGRLPGTEGMEKASNYVESYFKTIGVAPYFNGSYRDSLTILKRTSYNLVGVISAQTKTDEYVMMGAHLDHLGMNNAKNDRIFNGANDNASGVSAVLKITERLKQVDCKKNVLLVVFTEEESGLHGSTHLAKRLKKEGVNLRYVINFDMIGTPLTANAAQVYATGFDRSTFATQVNQVIGEEFIVFEKMDRVYGLFQRADNWPFYEEFHIPSHNVSTYDFKNFAEYHKVGDEFETLDPAFLEDIVGRLVRMAEQLLVTDAEVTLN